MEMDYQFHDVFGLDSELLAIVPQPCIALLLLFPINEKVQYHNYACRLCKYKCLYMVHENSYL